MLSELAAATCANTPPPSGAACQETMAARLGSASAHGLLSLLLLLAPPGVVQGQFGCTTNNGAITITGYAGPGGAVTIPSAINGLPVASIGGGIFEGAFASCLTLTSVTIPDSVTNIGNWAFYACLSLSNATMGNGVVSIGDFAFSGCTGLVTATFPKSVASIGQDAFVDCYALRSVTIPDGLTNVGLGAFAVDTNLTSVCFLGNAPGGGLNAFLEDGRLAAVYYLPGATGWGPTFGGIPAVLWNSQVRAGGAGFGVRTNQFGFTITGTSNLVVVVEGSTGLANPIWSPLSTNTLTGGATYFSDPQWTNYAARFYRLRLP